MNSRTLLYLLILMFTKSTFGQITYEPTFITQCKSKNDDILIWWLSDSTGTYWTDSIDFKRVVLPKAGNYSLHYDMDERPISLSLDNDTLIKDTFLLKRIYLINYISNPPISEYRDCDSLANGEVIDYYYSGKKRIEGLYNNGQLIDTMFTYYRNGQIDEIYIPDNKDCKRFNYYEHGQIKSIYETKKRYSKEYYLNGQIKERTYWSRKYKMDYKAYFESGILNVIQNDRIHKRYSENNILLERIKRKRSLKLKRIFSNKNSSLKQQFYKYEWSFFDPKGKLERLVVFNNSSFFSFPTHMNQIKQHMLDEIIFFKEGMVYKKIKLLFGEKQEALEKLNTYFSKHRKWSNKNNQ